MSLGRELGAFTPGHYLRGTWLGPLGFRRPVSVRLVPLAQSQAWSRWLSRLGNQRHGACPEVYRCETWREYRCTLAEPLEGLSLGRLLASGRGLPARRLEALAWQTALALAWAHSRGLAHGQLSEALLWLTPERYLKLLDWGLTPASAEADCQAYRELFDRLGAGLGTETSSMAERVEWFEARHRRRAGYEPLP